MDRARVTVNKKVEIKALLDCGMSQRRITTVIDVSKKCVYNASKKLKNNLPLSNTLGQGRKRASTALRIKIYYDYVRKIEPNLMKHYHLK